MAISACLPLDGIRETWEELAAEVSALKKWHLPMPTHCLGLAVAAGIGYQLGAGYQMALAWLAAWGLGTSIAAVLRPHRPSS